ncbi:hypothetical protein D3C78_1828420 [compost metagenome]
MNLIIHFMHRALNMLERTSCHIYSVDTGMDDLCGVVHRLHRLSGFGLNLTDQIRYLLR